MSSPISPTSLVSSSIFLYISLRPSPPLSSFPNHCYFLPPLLLLSSFSYSSSSSSSSCSSHFLSPNFSFTVYEFSVVWPQIGVSLLYVAQNHFYDFVMFHEIHDLSLTTLQYITQFCGVAWPPYCRSLFRLTEIHAKCTHILDMASC